MKVYGPYTGKDGRQRIVIYENGNRKTVSYPKYLVETKLGIKLEKSETVDHIDGNFLNNDFSNLRVVCRAEHAHDDCNMIVKKIILVNCLFCGKQFEYNTAKRYSTGSFCSNVCSGKYGKLIQTNKIKKIELRYIPKEYYKPKNFKHIEPVIRNNNSGHGGIGKLLTGNADDNTEGTGNRTP